MREVESSEILTLIQKESQLKHRLDTLRLSNRKASVLEQQAQRDMLQIEIDRANLEDTLYADNYKMRLMGSHTRNMRKEQIREERSRLLVQQQIIDAVKIQKTEEMKYVRSDDENTMQGLLNMHSQRDRLGAAFNVRVEPLPESFKRPRMSHQLPKIELDDDEGFVPPPVPVLS